MSKDFCYTEQLFLLPNLCYNKIERQYKKICLVQNGFEEMRQQLTPRYFLNNLSSQAADGFLFVVNCTTGTVVYVSDSITPVLNQPQVILRFS